MGAHSLPHRTLPHHRIDQQLHRMNAISVHLFRAHMMLRVRFSQQKMVHTTHMALRIVQASRRR
jgi:hypothetical protein